MSTSTEQRPPQVTLASTIIMVASVLVLFSVWERIATLGSLETQESIRQLLGEQPFDQLGLDLPAVTELLRITALVAAVGACATGILGWYVRKPDRSSRLALTIAAVPVFVAGFPVSGLAGSFVAAGAVMLWLVPAREWFATGRWTPPTPAEKTDAGRRTTPGAGDGAGHPGAGHPPTPPPAARPFGDAGPPPQQNPYGQPWTPPGQQVQQWQQGQLPPPLPPGYPPPPGWQPQPMAPPRPPALVTAFVITVVTAGGLFAISLMFLGVAASSLDVLMTELERQQPELAADFTAGEVRRALLGFGAGFLVWSTVALVLAGFSMARREWARRGLAVTAACSAVACGAAALAAPVVLLPAAAAVATVVCLHRGEVRRWFSLGTR
ncbi:hypothetical protein SAMN04489844_1000 [Nocardioides exalbidus]|uniref:Uncharacterized protein n=1 Tax=Nocardioides exalbidus TaxID=402596 RepID=A0A1H4LZ81_9ACTN|nr:hypothetical protein [Nocardioides exalbidus]SEB75877.1 hypothetical protein SAMN04489844_1000 [Nocardioides exalbidus]